LTNSATGVPAAGAWYRCSAGVDAHALQSAISVTTATINSSLVDVTNSPEFGGDFSGI